MENSKIKYNNLSTNYNRLLDLLDDGCEVVIIEPIVRLDGTPSKSSRVSSAKNLGNGDYDIDCIYSGFTKEEICESLEEHNLRFFDIEDYKTKEQVAEDKLDAVIADNKNTKDAFEKLIGVVQTLTNSLQRSDKKVEQLSSKLDMLESCIQMTIDVKNNDSTLINDNFEKFDGRLKELEIEQQVDRSMLHNLYSSLDAWLDNHNCIPTNHLFDTLHQYLYKNRKVDTAYLQNSGFFIHKTKSQIIESQKDDK